MSEWELMEAENSNLYNHVVDNAIPQGQNWGTIFHQHLPGPPATMEQANTPFSSGVSCTIITRNVYGQSYPSGSPSSGFWSRRTITLKVESICVREIFLFFQSRVWVPGR
jgi:hypothetical protein